MGILKFKFIINLRNMDMEFAEVNHRKKKNKKKHKKSRR